MKEINVKILSENATVPTRGHYNDSGLDLYASSDVIVQPGERVVVPTDIAIQLEDGFEAQVRPRSGVSSKTDLTVILGTVDAGYRGNIGVIVHNTSSAGEPKKTLKHIDGKEHDDKSGLEPEGTYLIKKGDKVAQMVVVPIALPKVNIVNDFESVTSRGESAYGSTGY